jgi:hypothetical protein
VPKSRGGAGQSVRLSKGATVEWGRCRTKHEAFGELDSFQEKDSKIKADNPPVVYRNCGILHDSNGLPVPSITFPKGYRETIHIFDKDILIYSNSW